MKSRRAAATPMPSDGVAGTAKKRGSRGRNGDESRAAATKASVQESGRDFSPKIYDRNAEGGRVDRGLPRAVPFGPPPGLPARAPRLRVGVLGLTATAAFIRPRSLRALPWFGTELVHFPNALGSIVCAVLSQLRQRPLVFLGQRSCPSRSTRRAGRRGVPRQIVALPVLHRAVARAPARRGCVARGRVLRRVESRIHE